MVMSKPVFVFGLTLGAVCVAWQLVSAATGTTGWFIPVATGIEAAVLITFFSRHDAALAWGRRALDGVAVSAIGAVLVFGGSLLVSQVLFPGLLASTASPPPSPLSAAGAGFMGTLVTGAALSGALAFFQRNAAPRGGG